jgi:UDP-N-acetylglucosamine 4,6-dehydratase/5-epimerase
MDIVTNAERWKGKTLAITGGSGSFGRKMLDHVLPTGIKSIRIISRDEFKHDELRKLYPDERITFRIADVRDAGALDDKLRGVDYLFHAAALKQVPSCETQPEEAVKTNILGSMNVLDAAIRASVASVVVLSTDKAVHPVNAMGISKAMMERIALSKARHSGNTAINVTRYGNVLFSRGSVIPFFMQRAQRGEALLVTDPAMTRFLLPLSDATKLVEHALFSNETGNLYVMKSAAASVQTIASAVRSHYNEDLEIRVIGVRSGEKTHETLLTEEEYVCSVDEGEYFKSNPARRTNKPRYAYTSDKAEQLDAAGLWELLAKQSEHSEHR